MLGMLSPMERVLFCCFIKWSAVRSNCLRSKNKHQTLLWLFVTWPRAAVQSAGAGHKDCVRSRLAPDVLSRNRLRWRPLQVVSDGSALGLRIIRLFTGSLTSVHMQKCVWKFSLFCSHQFRSVIRKFYDQSIAIFRIYLVHVAKVISNTILSSPYDVVPGTPSNCDFSCS